MHTLESGNPGELMAGEQILSARIGLLERRLCALAGLVTRAAGVTIDAVQEGVPDTCAIDAESQREMTTGFHLREYDEAGRPFRWAGRSDHFEFRFFLDRLSARPFQMRGLFAPGVSPDALAAYVDYRSIPVSVQTQDGMAVVAGRIPADPLSNTVTLTFFCPTAAAENPADRRRLSFAFSSLAAGLSPARLAEARPTPARARTRRIATA